MPNLQTCMILIGKHEFHHGSVYNEINSLYSSTQAGCLEMGLIQILDRTVETEKPHIVCKLRLHNRLCYWLAY